MRKSGFAVVALAVLLAVSGILWAAEPAVEGTPVPEVVVPGPSSGYIGVNVSSTTGEWGMGVPGSWGFQSNWPGSYGGDYGSIQIDGMNVYTNHYHAFGAVLQTPVTNGAVNEGIWQVGTTPLRVHQSFTLVKGTNSNVLDTYLLQYTVDNLDQTAHTVGCRMLVQFSTGNPGNGKFLVPGQANWLANEREWSGAQIPAYICEFNSYSSTYYDRAGQASFLGRLAAPPPDKVQIASWNLISANPFDYTVNTSGDLGYPSVAAYWIDHTVPAGGSITFSTYVGRATLAVDLTDPITLTTGPKMFDCMGGGYSLAPYPFMLWAYNLAGTKTYTGVTGTLTLPAGLALASGTATQSMPDLASHVSALATWMAAPTGSPTGSLSYDLTLAATQLAAPKTATLNVEVPDTCACATVTTVGVDGNSCPTILATVHVEDGLSQPVTGLLANSFKLQEDGVYQTIAVVPGATSGDYVVSYPTTHTDGSAHAITVSVTYNNCTSTTSGTAQCACSITCSATVPSSGYAGQTLAFASAVLATTCAGTPSYQWTFGDGATSTSQNVSHAYAAAGSYNWTLQVDISGNHCTKTGSITVASGPPFVVTAAADAASGNAPLTVHFTGSASGGTPPYAYNWSFSHGFPSSEQNPAHVFNATGDYTVTLTVTDAQSRTASDSHLVIHVTGTSVFTASALADPTSGDAPLPVHFQAIASGGVPPYTYTWSFGDFTASADQNPAHIYSGAGNYNVVLIVRDHSGTSVADTHLSIHVTGQAALAASATASSTSGTRPVSVNFTGVATGGLAPYFYFWSFGDGTASSEQNPSHTYANAGDYSVVLIVLDASGTLALDAHLMIHVVSVPPPAVTLIKAVNGPPFTLVCTGSNLQNGIRVTINGTQWTGVLWKTTSKVKLTGSTLKTAVPKGTPTTFTFVNPDGGTQTVTNWSY